MTTYDEINRAERAICSHLFRLLHETRDGSFANGALAQFLNFLQGRSITLLPDNGVFSPSGLSYTNVQIFAEVSLIRDAYFSKKPHVDDLMDSLTKQVMEQEGISRCRLFSELPPILRDVTETHPKQIRLKAKQVGVQLTSDEWKVYGAIQGMFNAKPDLAITVDRVLVVIEAKFTEAFDDTQMTRTQNIAQIWTSTFFRKYLGFSSAPSYCVIKLGASKHNPDISWAQIFSIVPNFYDTIDRSFVAFEGARKLLNKLMLE